MLNNCKFENIAWQRNNPRIIEQGNIRKFVPLYVYINYDHEHFLYPPTLPLLPPTGKKFHSFTYGYAPLSSLENGHFSRISHAVCKRIQRFFISVALWRHYGKKWEPHVAYNMSDVCWNLEKQQNFAKQTVSNFIMAQKATEMVMLATWCTLTAASSNVQGKGLER